MIKNPRETVTIPVEVDRYILEAVPGRYFQCGTRSQGQLLGHHARRNQVVVRYQVRDRS